MRALCAAVLALTLVACSGQDKPTTTPTTTTSEQGVPAADDTTPDTATDTESADSGDLDSEEPCPEMPSCGGE